MSPSLEDPKAYSSLTAKDLILKTPASPIPGGIGEGVMRNDEIDE